MGKSRFPAQIARDRRHIGTLYLQGCLQADIAEKVGVSQATVSRDLKALHKKWLASASRDFATAKAKEIAKIDHLERTYYAAWERSCEDAKTITQKQKGKAAKRKDQDGEFIAERPAEVSKISKEQAGDPRFLQGVQWCIDKRCKIWGVDAPVKVEHSGSVEQQIVFAVSGIDLKNDI